MEKVQKTVDGPPGEEVKLEGLLVGRRALPVVENEPIDVAQEELTAEPRRIALQWIVVDEEVRVDRSSYYLKLSKTKHDSEYSDSAALLAYCVVYSPKNVSTGFSI